MSEISQGVQTHQRGPHDHLSIEHCNARPTLLVCRLIWALPPIARELAQCKQSESFERNIRLLAGQVQSFTCLGLMAR